MNAYATPGAVTVALQRQVEPGLLRLVGEPVPVGVHEHRARVVEVLRRGEVRRRERHDERSQQTLRHEPQGELHARGQRLHRWQHLQQELVRRCDEAHLGAPQG
jgi:hypothetical protein